MINEDSIANQTTYLQKEENNDLPATPATPTST